MFGVLKRNPVSVLLAVLLHGLILFFLVFGVDWTNPTKPATPKTDIVQAHTVDAEQLRQADAKEREAERQKQLQQEKRKRAEEEKRRQAQEQQRIAEQKAERQKREAEAKRQARIKKERLAKEAKQKAEAKRKAEIEKRKAEQEAKRLVEAKRKAAVEAKRKAEAAAAQAERERALQTQLAAEQNSREIDRYVAVIKQQIERSWLKPGQSDDQLSCVVQVRLIPGGDVVPGGVSIIRSSGNAAFDRSVETAVYKAAPLPVPSGLLFESFRTLKLNFKMK
ncbi:MAG: cell envelope integrity protein TolA [Candidatus Thiodiazotropha sp. (ex Epidulcina cf. delphinae)]|nr:cell envelope integrity protein TolA [Candidatus Thiodiazotropha sp. (ex Epidulcina cf. delphinae)]